MKLAILSDEFFDPKLQGMGGFGWAAWQAAQILGSHQEFNVDPVFISGQLRESADQKESTAHGCRVLFRPESTARDVLKLRREQFDLLLSIDYNQGYSRYLRALPRTPADADKVHSCRVPGEDEGLPQGLYCVNALSLGGTRRHRRRVLTS